MSSIMNTALALPAEKAVVFREHANGLYSALAYFFGRISVLLFFQLVYAVAFATLAYFMVGFTVGVDNYILFVLTISLVSVISGCLGYFAGILLETPQKAAAVIPALVVPLTLMSGLFIALPNIPVYWRFLYYLSFFQYALQVLSVLEWRDTDLEPCTVDQLLNPTGSCPYGACSPSSVDINGTLVLDPQPCPGTIVLELLDYDPDFLAQNLVILASFVVVFLILGYLALLRLLSVRR